MKKSRPTFILRLVFIAALFFAVLVVYAGKLLNLQIAGAAQIAAQNAANQYYTTETVVPAVRGEIYDRNGVPLVTNRYTYNLQLDYAQIPADQIPAVSSELLDLFASDDITYTDTFPVVASSGTAGTEWAYSTQLTSDANIAAQFARFLKQFSIDPSISADALIQQLTVKFGLSDYPAYRIRPMIGIRYQMELSQLTSSGVYTMLTNIGANLIAGIKQHTDSYLGVNIAVQTVRVYDQGPYASQILGRIGKITQDELDSRPGEGYTADSYVGKSGAEAAFEDYLRGTDGILVTKYDQNGIVQDSYYKVQPKDGKNVYLTIDIKLQITTELALQRGITWIVDKANPNKALSGEDADAGAIVVQDPNNGQILAMATNPTYSQVTFQQDIDKLNSDPLSPMLNRATQWALAPGSIFKIATAAAALTDGVITKDTLITDKGVYTKYAPNYEPSCWIYSSEGITHGTINVEQAIQDSCDYFFWVVSEKLSITQLDQYCKTLGLGEPTGIEIGEKSGTLAGPATVEPTRGVWQPGDMLGAVIGQSYNAFTPVQLVSYFSTVVNGGTRYRTHILLDVKDYYTDNVYYTAPTEVLNTVQLSADDLNTLKIGMKGVVSDGGLAASIFDKYPIPIGAKTGTAQVDNTHSDNATFVCFAPYDNPQITICSVVEHGASGTSAGYATKDIMDVYFGLKSFDDYVKLCGAVQTVNPMLLEAPADAGTAGDTQETTADAAGTAGQ